MTAAGGDDAAAHTGADGAAAIWLRRLVEDAAAGRFPLAIGGTQVVPSPDGPVHAVLAFTAGDTGLSRKVAERGRAVERMIDRIGAEHEKRLASGACAVRSSLNH